MRFPLKTYIGSFVAGLNVVQSFFLALEGGQKQYSFVLYCPEGEAYGWWNFPKSKRAMLQVPVSIKSNDL